MKTKQSRLLGALLCLIMALLPAAGLAAPATGTDWDISKSKTATNLDEHFESQVTLSLPSAEVPLVTDVVFVFDDSSCNAQNDVTAAVERMLDELYKQFDHTGATIKIGAVKFRGEVTKYPLRNLDATTKTTLADFMDKRPETGGSNMSAGILAGEKMLDADPYVDPSRKYMILVSDGITYIWDDPETPAQENYGVNFANADSPNNPMLASPDGWDVKYGPRYFPTDWEQHFNTSLIEKTINERASLYVRGEDISDKPFVANGEKEDYASTVDISLYKSMIAYNRVAEKYNTFVVAEGVKNEMELYPFGPSFMSFLADGKTVSFSEIQNDILYLLDAGSTVVDVMGKTQDYDFDFVNDAAKLTLTVGGVKLDVHRVKENHYGFGALADGTYRFELIYTPESVNSGDSFVWKINENVSITRPVQLTYSVVLTNPQTVAGVYGLYDRDGSKGYSGLYTNNSAILTPVDSAGTPGAKEAFAKPTVSYTVGETEVPVTPAPPATGDNTPIALCLVLLAVSGGVIIAAIHNRRTRCGR